VIELVHLRKEYPGVIPFKDVNVTIDDGDVVSIIGPSGTGKSTLLRCINLLEKPTSGQVFVDGVDIANPKNNINQLRQKIGMVFQSFNLYEHLTIIENVMLAQTKLLGRSRQDAFDYGMELLASVGLADHALYFPSQLSGGQKQRAAIARTLATDPSIILFDEPTSALDPLMVGEVQAIIEKLAHEGRTMMIVTHEMDFARKVANRVFYLDEGGIYEDGTPEQIFEHPQKEKTRQFIFHLSNLDILVPATSFNLSKAVEDIAQFGRDHKLGERRIYRLQIVFEEFCVTYLQPYLEEGKHIQAIICYAEGEDKLTMRIRHGIAEQVNKEPDDITSRNYIDHFSSSCTRLALTDGNNGMLEEIVFGF